MVPQKDNDQPKIRTCSLTVQYQNGIQWEDEATWDSFIASRSLGLVFDQQCQIPGQCPILMKNPAMLRGHRSGLNGFHAASCEGAQFSGGRDHATQFSWLR